MPTCYIVDAFPAFLEFWPSIRHKTIDEQIDAWETGYYLGHRVIRRLEASMDLHQIAVLDEIEPLLRNELDHLAAAGGRV